jgi:hypothetical protein
VLRRMAVRARPRRHERQLEQEHRLPGAPVRPVKHEQRRALEPAPLGNVATCQPSAVREAPRRPPLAFWVV